MTRQELIEMENEHQFRELLAKSKLSDDDKARIIRDRQIYMWQMFLAGNPVKTVTGTEADIYREPLTGRIRFNTGERS